MTTGRSRIDYVSPLPPVRSGIADYSADLLPHLERECDLRVVRVPGQDVAEALCARFAPVPFERLGDDGRLPLYQVGNNAYHAAIVERALHAPGVVTLHDFTLHHLLQERTLAGGDLDAYVRSLVADHGWIGGAVSLVPRWHGYGRAALFALPAHRSLLGNQRGVVVHSEWARGALRDEGIETPVEVVPMPMPMPPEISPSVALGFRERHRIAADSLVVGSLGFQTPIKRTEVVLRALTADGLGKVVLVVGGSASPAIDLVAVARELGVAERVRFTGFLEAEEYRAAVAACDLCVNLRYPSAGETSAALLRVASFGKPVLVSSYAQFAELPEEVALRVPVSDESPREEVEALVAIFRRGLEERGALRETGRRARAWVASHHDPQTVARRLGAILRSWSANGGSGTRPRAADERASVGPPPARPARPTSLTWGRFEGWLSVRGVEGWRPGERRSLEIELYNASFARWLAAERGPGGLAVEVSLCPERGAPESLPWLPLPVDLEPLEAWRFRLLLRRPLGGCRLRVEPHVAGLGGFSSVGGPVWDALLSGDGPEP
ncbi:MAG TPA: glycosyltransferase family 4 protein [Thermoanaerobaculia bacterium]|nr:glycosyltransferase family 4 protein [Thermoanaerobaculia bacterium]